MAERPRPAKNVARQIAVEQEAVPEHADGFYTTGHGWPGGGGGGRVERSQQVRQPRRARVPAPGLRREAGQPERADDRRPACLSDDRRPHRAWGRRVALRARRRRHRAARGDCGRGSRARCGSILAPNRPRSRPAPGPWGCRRFTPARSSPSADRPGGRPGWRGGFDIPAGGPILGLRRPAAGRRGAAPDQHPRHRASLVSADRPWPDIRDALPGAAPPIVFSPPIEPPDTVVEIEPLDTSAVPTLRLDDLKAMDIEDPDPQSDQGPRRPQRVGPARTKDDVLDPQGAGGAERLGTHGGRARGALRRLRVPARPPNTTTWPAPTTSTYRRRRSASSTCRPATPCRAESGHRRKGSATPR